jgi:hypothetical protein
MILMFSFGDKWQVLPFHIKSVIGAGKSFSISISARGPWGILRAWS